LQTKGPQTIVYATQNSVTAFVELGIVRGLLLIAWSEFQSIVRPKT
jgi:hypothetical protein